MTTDVTLRHKDVTLLELLDRVLDKGVVVAGDLTISVADIDLVYLGLRLMLCSIETMEHMRRPSRELLPPDMRTAMIEAGKGGLA